MYLKLIFETVGELVLKLEDKEFHEKLNQYIPFESRVHVWKEEIYFSTPLDYTPKEYVSRVERGSIGYWRPGKALCIFYGISQPYSKLGRIGKVVGLTTYLYGVEEGSTVKVEEYRHYKRVLEEIELLRRRGLEAVSRVDEEGNICICISTDINGRPLGLEVIKEEYGYYIETDGIFRFTNTLRDIALVNRVKYRVERIDEDVRIDLNEDGWLIISSIADRENLYDKVKHTIEAYKVLVKALT